VFVKRVHDDGTFDAVPPADDEDAAPWRLDAEPLRNISCVLYEPPKPRTATASWRTPAPPPLPPPPPAETSPVEVSAAKPAGSFAKGVMPRACGGVMSSGRQVPAARPMPSGRQRPDLREVGPKPCGRPPNGTNGMPMRWEGPKQAGRWVESDFESECEPLCAPPSVEEEEAEAPVEAPPAKRRKGSSGPADMAVAASARRKGPGSTAPKSCPTTTTTTTAAAATTTTTKIKSSRRPVVLDDDDSEDEDGDHHDTAPTPSDHYTAPTPTPSDHYMTDHCMTESMAAVAAVAASPKRPTAAPAPPSAMASWRKVSPLLAPAPTPPLPPMEPLGRRSVALATTATLPPPPPSALAPPSASGGGGMGMLCMQPPGRLVQLLRGLYLTRSALMRAFEGGKRHALPRALLRMRVARGYVLVEIVHAQHDGSHSATPDCTVLVQGPGFKQGEATRVSVKEVSSGHPEPNELEEMARAVAAGCCQQGESTQTAGLRAAMLEAVRSAAARDLPRPRDLPRITRWWRWAGPLARCNPRRRCDPSARFNPGPCSRRRCNPGPRPRH